MANERVFPLIKLVQMPLCGMPDSGELSAARSELQCLLAKRARDPRPRDDLAEPLRHLSSHRMPQVRAASMVACVSCRSLRRSPERAGLGASIRGGRSGPNEPSRSIPVVRWTTVQPGKFFSSARRNFGSISEACGPSGRGRPLVAVAADVQARRTAWPMRWTWRRRVVPFKSASSTRRTILRSLDQRCIRHFSYSPEIEYFASARSKTIAPSSMTTAAREPSRNSVRILASESGVMTTIVRRSHQFSSDDCTLQLC